MTRRTYELVAAVAGLLATGLIAASLVGVRAGESAPPARSPDRAATALLSGIPQHGAVLGRPDAPVTLVEFADVQCPYCATWADGAFAEIVRDSVRPGKARIVFSGLAFLGPESETGLRFALAAGRQGKLWQAVHLLYANQGSENSGWVTDDFLRQTGAAIPGLDTERALRESFSPEVDRQMAEAREAATRLGVQGTPSFAAGRTGTSPAPIAISSLDADALRPALDSLLAG
jgi:protein-disulfide isomerase